MMNIPFNRPWISGLEVAYITEVLQSGHLSGNGAKTKDCQAILTEITGCQSALLTQSCTAALEMAALITGIGEGDEVIMPSYTFVSTANAFLLRGAIPVFVDIRPDTLNIDENQIESAITEKTKAIVPVHYAGVPCDMGRILEVAKSYNLLVISDAAQAIGSSYEGIDVSSLGDLSTISFHETKNISSGEGGALIINNLNFLERASVIWEKGTNRKAFFEGTVDKYTWIDLGSSYLPSEITAAILLSQLRSREFILKERFKIWNFYHSYFQVLEEDGIIRRPIIPDNCLHNAHMYYILLDVKKHERSEFLDKLRALGIHAVFHYLPLHNSPAGLKYGKSIGQLRNTIKASHSLVRLPLWIGLSNSEVTYVCKKVDETLRSMQK
jgi:dTDP-4-amino-4,6-dideoxygalactose transaminase